MTYILGSVYDSFVKNQTGLEMTLVHANDFLFWLSYSVKYLFSTSLFTPTCGILQSWHLAFHFTLRRRLQVKC